MIRAAVGEGGASRFGSGSAALAGKTAQIEIEATAKKLETTRAQARTATLDDLRSRMELAQDTLQINMKRIENMRADLGEIANAQEKYAQMRDERKALRERQKSIKESIEQIMALQSSDAVTDVRWHTMPEK